MPTDDEAACLRRIADVLGIPVERFAEDRTPAVIDDTRECMWLWGRLRTDAGRAAALDALRRVLDDEGAGGVAGI